MAPGEDISRKLQIIIDTQIEGPARHQTVDSELSRAPDVPMGMFLIMDWIAPALLVLEVYP